MKKNRTFKKFEDWNPIDIEKKIGVWEIDNPEMLAKWFNPSTITVEPPQAIQELLQQLRIELKRFLREWNEAELTFQFISPLLMTIKFRGNEYNQFMQRKLIATINEAYQVQGVVDYMVASGIYEPEHPYFFLHEYKRFKGTEADPLGQLLIAMIAAQIYNNDGLPVYGCFVVGATWTFVLLEGNQYATSQSYDAKDEQELRIIWNILHHTKQIIEERVKASPSVNSLPKTNLQ